MKLSSTEAEFLDVIGTKVSNFFLRAIHSHPPPQKRFETGCNANIVFGNLKSENSRNYAQKPQRNCSFMNLPSVPK